MTIPDKSIWALYLCAWTRRGRENSTSCLAERVRGSSPGLSSGHSGEKPRPGGDQKRPGPRHRRRTSADCPRARGAGSPIPSRRRDPAAKPLTLFEGAQHLACRGQPSQPQGTPGTPRNAPMIGQCCGEASERERARSARTERRNMGHWRWAGVGTALETARG